MYKIYLVYNDNINSFGKNKPITNATCEVKNIVLPGLKNNSRVELCRNIDQSDYIFVVGNKSFKNKKPLFDYKDKIIVLDFDDTIDFFLNIPHKLYFKRSVVSNLKFVNKKTCYIPISFCLRPQNINTNIDKCDRDIDIGVFFSPRHKNGDLLPDNNNIIKNRRYIAKFIQDNFKKYNIHVGLVGKRGKEGRNNIQKQYFNLMKRSKIVVTCGPGHCEGDYRLFESLSCGCLVFSENMITPVINKFIHKKHLIYYDKKDSKKLKEELLYYLDNHKERQKISLEGYTFSNKYHKPENRIDEVIDKIEESTAYTSSKHTADVLPSE